MRNTKNSSKENTGASDSIDAFTKGARNSFVRFCEIIDRKYNAEPFHELIAQKLEEGYRKLKAGEDVRLIFEMPPRHGKSEEITIKFPAWILGDDPSLPILECSYNDTLANTFGLKARDTIQSGQYSRIFPGTIIRQDQKAKGRWLTGSGGGFSSVGIGGTITGTGFKIGIIDDPFKNREEADSITFREKVWDFYRSTFYTRQEGNTMIVIICTRWHMDDLVGRIEEQENAHLSGREAEFSDAWEYVTFPAIAEENESFEVNGRKYLRKKGEALWPKKFPIEKLRTIENELGPYEFCTPAETPIIMFDWTVKSIIDVKPGDWVLGFKRGTPKKRALLIPSKVTCTYSMQGKVFDIKMESGRKVRCTENHKWYTKRKEGSDNGVRKEYMPAAVGRRLMFVEEPKDDELTLEQHKLWSYLAGIIDGEGHIGKSAIFITQAVPRNKEVADKIRSTLLALGISFNELRNKQSNPKWSEKIDFVLRDASSVYRKLLRYTGIAKKEQIIKRMYANGHMFVKEQDKVVAIENPKDEQVVSLETTTGNYIAWGYASSNSALYQQSPVPSERQEFKRQWFKAWDFEEMKRMINKNRLQYFTMCDPNASEEEVEANDEWVVITIAKERMSPNIYRVEESAGKGDTAQMLGAIMRHVETYRSKFGIETVNAKALMYAIKEEQKKRENYFTIYEMQKNRRLPKEVRIRGMIPRYAAGVLWHMPDDKKYEQQLMDFPKGKHDDRIDAMANFVEMLEQFGLTDYGDDGSGKDWSEYHKLELDPYPKAGKGIFDREKDWSETHENDLDPYA